MDDEPMGEIVGEENPLQKGQNACVALCLGIVLFPISLFLLGWNEHRYVCEDKNIIFADTKSVEVGCSSSGLTGEFAFFSCPIQESSLQTFYPCMFNTDSHMDCESDIGKAFSFKSVSASQYVEMVQCKMNCQTETRKVNGRNQKVETCDYESSYEPTYQSSTDFRDQNLASQRCNGYNPAQGNPRFPSNVDPGTSADSAAGPILVGDVAASYTLNDKLVKQLTPDMDVQLANVATNLTSNIVSPTQPPVILTRSNVVINGNYLQTCLPGNEQVGCVRISYKKSSSTSPSVLTSVGEGGMTEPAQAPGGWLCGPSAWQAINAKKMDKATMIATLKGENTTTVYILRILGVFMAWGAVYCMFSPIAAAADILGDCINICPCGGYVEDCLEGIVTTVLCGLSCGIGCSCAFVVIGLVWLVMRPLYGSLMLLVACCCCGGAGALYTAYKGDKNSSQKELDYDSDINNE
eukprot:CAMPEP_0117570656 /NCGR_PEP_ID=MMETSP0784-20121206/59316_1 /TAXON_ID=39447 /ORGANISM="" /LENGTH=464 /DNA_ID=CAMNT_0005368727 /DNA_START=20 /DNA_END=1414 /DNA_ORIENTATION=+